MVDSIRRRSLLGATAMCGCAVAFTASAAFAASAEAESTNNVEELVVTGSRLQKNEYTSPLAIQVITAESLEERGLVDTATALQQSSLASGSIQQNQSTIGFGQSGIQGGNGLASVSLRGLGATRTLVLLNGRRVSPAGAGSSIGPVDLSVIPQSVIARVDILKDGASSIYGTDAIGGVVNIITKNALKGGDLRVYANKTQDKGGETYQISGSYGWTFDRARLLVAGELYRQERVSLASRDYLNCYTDYIFAPGTDTRVDVIDPKTNKAKCLNVYSGGVQIPALGAGFLQYDPTGANGPYTGPGYDGTISTANPGLAALAAQLRTQGFYRVAIPGNPTSYGPATYDNPEWAPNMTAIPQTDRGSLYLNGGIDFTPDIEGYGELLLTRRNSLQQTYGFTHPTIPAGLANPYGVTALPWIQNPQRAQTQVDFVQTTVGVRGVVHSDSFLDGWRWDAYGQYAHSWAKYTGKFPLTDSFLYADGLLSNGECFVNGVTVTPTQRPCAKVNWFSPGKLAGTEGYTPEEQKYLFLNAAGHTDYVQQIAEASASGDLFHVPAGIVSAALGVQYRYNEINDQPDPDSQIGNTGFVNSSIGATTLGPLPPTLGHLSNVDYYGEIGIPIFRDLPLAKDVSLNLSGRVTNETGGESHATYRINGNWTITPEYRIRGSYGTSFRSAALFERLSSATLGYFQTQVDPCINPSSTTVAQRCAAQGIPANYNGVGPNGGTPFAAVTSGGNPDLDPETSKTYTVGMVWAPSMIDLSVAVDYWHINLQNKIASLGAQEVSLCYNAVDYPTSIYCGLFTRDTNPQSVNYLTIATVQDALINISSEVTNGYDLTLAYRRPIWWDTNFAITTQATWTLHDKTRSRPELDPVEVNGNRLQPRFSGVTSFRFERDGWALTWNVQMYSHTSANQLSGGDLGTSQRSTGLVSYKRWTEFTTYHDVSLRKQFDKVNAQIGVQNLFGEDPPAVSSDYIYRRGESPLSLYDFLGRRAYIALSTKF